MRVLDAITARDDWDVVGVAAAHRNEPRLVPFRVPVVHMRLGRRVLYMAWHRLRRPCLAARVGSVDIVHATGGVVPPPGDAALVVTIHDLAFLHRPEHFSRHGVSFMTRGFDLAKAQARVIVVPSESTANDCIAHGVDTSRVCVVPWGVAPAAVGDRDRARVRERFGLPEDFVLWVGTAEPRKNLETLVAAMGRVADVPLILAGPRGWGVELDRLVAGAPGTRHIGEVPDDDLGALYDLATVFVYPSLLEGFGMPVLEAMAQGTAVVTSRATSTEEVAGGAAVVVDPADAHELADAIAALLGDDDRRNAVAAAGPVRTRDLTWTRTAELTVAAYERALE